MIPYSFKSKMNRQIYSFIEYKNKLGFPYLESSRILKIFDDFCMARFPAKENIDSEMAFAWLEKRETEGFATHRNRIMVIREFAKYLNAVGEKAYLIPITMTRKAPRYVPHIFTESEIRAFFHGADQFQPHPYAPARHIVVPVFFRLLYCCGLRPVEARLLKKDNVDLIQGTIFIEESKGHKDRIVVMPDDLLKIMRIYYARIKAIFPDCSYFFPGHEGKGAYSKHWTEETFWKCFELAGITQFDGPKPRVYDFRHTFATNCIYRWIREGKDVHAMLPVLSAYMGHARFEDTLYYFHIIPDFYDRTKRTELDDLADLLPEVHNEN